MYLYCCLVTIYSFIKKDKQQIPDLVSSRKQSVHQSIIYKIRKNRLISGNVYPTNLRFRWHLLFIYLYTPTQGFWK